MTEEKNLGGRPRISMDEEIFTAWDQLDALIVWASAEHCAEKLGMSVDTLTRRIKEKKGMTFPEYKDLKKGALRANLFKKQYEVAMSGNPTMLIFLGKNELGQSDKIETKNEHNVSTNKALVDMSKEEKIEMLEKYREQIENERMP